MKELDEVVVESLDGVDKDILPYLPYILQDLWAFGADPEVMVKLAMAYSKKGTLNILDLGCGKGAVSIALAKNLDCKVKGIDAMEPFIEAARNYAFLNEVQDNCDFVTGDIRVLVESEEQESQYDIVVLGSIGSVLGDMYQTLMSINPILNESGVILIDDAYIRDDSKTDYDRCLRESEFYKQIDEAGFDIHKEIVCSEQEVADSDAEIAQVIKARIHELIQKEPQNKELFLGYLASQEYEFEIIDQELVTGTWMLKQRLITQLKNPIH